MIKLAGVIVLYNPTKEVINNIKTYIQELDKLYLIDNTPNKDNSCLFHMKKVEYISNMKNLGIATALNIAAKKAIKEKYNWLLTMDQDSKFSKNSFSILVNYLKQYRKNNDLNIEISKIGLISPFHMIPQREGMKPTGIETPLMVMTSGNIINLAAYKKIGGFKDWLFIDAVDFDYCLNLRDHGYEIVQVNDAKLIHNLGNTVRKKIGDKVFYVSNHNAMRRYYIVRNRHYFLDMYQSRYPDFCNAEKKMTKKELIKIWLYEKQKCKKTFAMLQGYLDYKKGIKGEKNEKIFK